MGNEREQYRQLNAKHGISGEAPSGQLFVYRGLNLFQLSKVGSLPTLGERKAQGDMKAQERMELEQHFYNTIVACTLSPRIVLEGDPNNPDAIPIEEISSDDLNWLYHQIMVATGLVGQKADEARSFRGERGELREASRNGEGHGGEAEPASGDVPGRVPSARRRVRSHRVDKGEGVARGAAGEGD